jgi:hypothetical protein
VHLEASTKPHVHRKFEIFWTNIASTMACPNFKNGPKNGLMCLGVNDSTYPLSTNLHSRTIKGKGLFGLLDDEDLQFSF